MVHVDRMLTFLTGLFMQIVFSICSTVMSTQGSGNHSCGRLVALTNNIVEGQFMSLRFTTNPGQNITWQREVASHYVDVKRSEVYNMRSFDESKVHRLYFWRTSSQNTNSGNYRVKCFKTFSNPVYVNIGKASTVEKIYPSSACQPVGNTTQIKTSTDIDDAMEIKCEMDSVATYDNCGTLTSIPVQEGHNVTLVYVPEKKYINHSRKWYKYVDNEYMLLYDSAADITSKSSKYIEVTSGKDYRIAIHEPAFKSHGDYLVMCQDQVVSNTYRLPMLRGDSTTVAAFDNHSPTDTTTERRVTQVVEELEESSNTESSGPHYTGENMFLIGIGIGVIIGFVVTTGFVTVILAIRKRLRMSKSRKPMSERDAVAPNEGLPTKRQTASNSGYLSLRHTCEIGKNNFRTEYSQPEMTSRPNLEDDENDYEIPV